MDDFDARIAARMAELQAASQPATPTNVVGNNSMFQWADDNVRRAADGATFGYADKLEARMNSIFGDTYEQELERSRKLTEDAGKRLGRGAVVADIAGGVGGALTGGALVRGGAALAGMGGVTAPARALLAADNAGVAGRAAVGAADGVGQAVLDAASHDKALTANNVGTSALLGGGIAGGLAAAGRARLPTSMTPEEQRLAGVLQQNGIEMTAGQRTGSKALRNLESTLGDLPFAGSQGRGIAERQAEAFNRAALRTAGADAPVATGAVLNATQRTLGNRIEQIANRNAVAFDQQFGNDLLGVVREYGQNLPGFQRDAISNIIGDIGLQGGFMQGRTYQKTRSRLSRMASGEQGDTEYARALRGVRDALDEVATKSINPADAAAWQTARRQYANYKSIEKAMGAAGEEVARGNISPRALRTAVKTRDPVAYAQGRGDLTDLVHAGEAFLKPLPNSGTAPRQFYQRLVAGGAPGAGIGGLMGGGVPGAVVGAAASIAGPAIAARALYSRPVQRALGSGAPQGPAGPLSHAALQAAYPAGLLGGTEDAR